MYNNDHWCQMIAYEKITEARRAAAQDRLAITAVQASRGAALGARSRVAGLLRAVANGLDHGRPVQERKVPAGNAQ